MQDLYTIIDPSLSSLQFAVVFVTAFYWEKYSIKYGRCQQASWKVAGGANRCVTGKKITAKGGKSQK